MPQVFSWASPWNHDNRCSPCSLLTDEVHDWTGVNNRSPACPEHNWQLKCMCYPEPASKDTACNRLFFLAVILLASCLPPQSSRGHNLSLAPSSSLPPPLTATGAPTHRQTAIPRARPSCTVSWLWKWCWVKVDWQSYRAVCNPSTYIAASTVSSLAGS